MSQSHHQPRGTKLPVLNLLVSLEYHPLIAAHLIPKRSSRSTYTTTHVGLYLAQCCSNPIVTWSMMCFPKNLAARQKNKSKTDKLVWSKALTVNTFL